MFPRTQIPKKTIKIKDFLQEENHGKSSDFYGLISSIGELKHTPHRTNKKGPTENIPAREIVLFDDSWSKIKMIVRQENAYKSGSFELYQVLLVKNAQAVKIKNYIVLITIGETQLDAVYNTPEAIALTQWYFENSQDLAKGEKLFYNLSVDVAYPVPVIPNTTISNPSTSNSQTFGAIRISPVSKINKKVENSQNINNQSATDTSNQNINNSMSKVIEEQEKRTSVDTFTPSAATGLPKKQKLEIISPSKLPKTLALQNNAVIKTASENLNTASEIQVDEIIILGDDDKKEFSQDETVKTDDKSLSEDSGISQCSKSPLSPVVFSDKIVENDLPNETFRTIMECPFFSDKMEWSEKQDGDLINYIIKNPDSKLNNIFIYEQILKEKPHIFPPKQISVQMLMCRAKELGSVQNYLYLLHLCGARYIKTEDELNEFIKRVNKLRGILCLPL